MRMKHNTIALILIQLFVISAVVGALSPTVSAGQNDANTTTSNPDFSELSPSKDVGFDWFDAVDDLESEFARGEVLVKFRTKISTGLKNGIVETGISSIDELNRRFKVKRIERLFSDVYKLTLPKDADAHSVVLQYDVDPNVEYAEPNSIGSYYVAPDDPYYQEGKQWFHNVTEAEYAWNTTTGSPEITIAIIDTGVDYNHPDLNSNIWVNPGEDLNGNGIADWGEWPNGDIDYNDTDGNGYVDDLIGWDFRWDDNDPSAYYFHGTHVAGLAAAVTNNSIGVAGVSWHSKIMVISADQPITVGVTASAISYAANNGADIISMSWGFRDSSETLYRAIKDAFDRDVLLIAAAGNEHWATRIYPAAFQEVVAVTGTDEDDNPWVGSPGGSNYGGWVEIAAPASNLYSTTWGNLYGYASGTSGATPIVAGVAALIWSRFPNMGRDWVRYQLRRTAVDKGDPGFDIYYGYGRINASGAVNQNIPNHDLLVSSWKLPFASEPNDTVTVNTTVLNFGTKNKKNIDIELLVNGTKEDSTQISALNGGESTTVSCSWIPTNNGTYNITTYVKPKPQEDDEENNSQSAYIWVSYGKVVKVPEDFATIKEAVNTTNLEIYYGDATIQVASGTYYEHNLTIQNSLTSLTLIGENRSTTIIDSQGEGAGSVWINSNNITIMGFTIQNISTAGIQLSYADNSTISYNTIIKGSVGHGDGIYVESTICSSIISNNSILYTDTGIVLFTDHLEPQFDLSHLGVHLVINNTILYSASNGVYLEYSSNNIIRDNTISNSFSNGLTLSHWSNNNSVSGNIISDIQGVGVEIVWSDDNSVSNNTISNSTNSGIKLSSKWKFNRISERNDISGNTLQYNTNGIYISDDSRDNNINDNTLQYNTNGIYEGLTGSNTIYHNNFIDNTNQVISISEYGVWDDGYPSGGNFWSDYNGTDLYSGPYQNESDSDSIGDTPYEINQYQQDNYPLMHPWGSIRNVDTGLIYLTIQKAINANETLNGHTIEVKAGTYYENVFLNKSLTLVGEDPNTTIINDNSQGGHVVAVLANNVTVSNFTIQDGYISGIALACNYSTVRGNTISNNEMFGISLVNASSNTIYHNNFMDNGWGNVFIDSGYANFWDNGYPSGGNYWSDYTGVDYYSGPNQDQPGSDGIGDTPYAIAVNNQDNYPLIHPWGAIRNVDTDLIYLTIQKAIDATQTSDGHTIEVKAGTYYENVVVNKDLTLMGENPSTTIIDGSDISTKNVVTIETATVTISGFTIQNGGRSGIKVHLCPLGGGIVIGNIITNNFVGISIEDYTHNAQIVDNTISANTYGIYLLQTENNTISSNTVSNNVYAITLMQSDGNTVNENTISNNWYSGVDLSSYSDNNVIYHNNFINNPIQAACLGGANVWDDGYPSGGNFWSDYNGTDLYSGPYQNETGSDGIWDEPYNITLNNVDYYPHASMHVGYGWGYRKSHVINSASGAGTNYQIKIKAHYGSGTDSGQDVYLNNHSRQDFGDVRFTDDSGIWELDYWMEEKVDGDYAIFWVEVTKDLSSQSQTIYIYYGKAEATTKSNGANTFLFFDDCEDLSRWTEDYSSGTPIFEQTTIDGYSVIRLQTNAHDERIYIKSTTTVPRAKAIVSRIKHISFNSDSYHRFRLHWVNSTNWIDYHDYESYFDRYQLRKLVNGSHTIVDTYSVAHPSGWYTYEVYDNGTNTDVNRDTTDILDGVISDAALDSDGYLYIMNYQYNGGTSELAFDHIFVRNYVDPEPSHGSWGSEQQLN